MVPPGSGGRHGRFLTKYLGQTVPGTLNVYSQVGLVMLVGLITKHGILIVEFANQLRGPGAWRGWKRSSRRPRCGCGRF